MRAARGEPWKKFVVLRSRVSTSNKWGMLTFQVLQEVRNSLAFVLEQEGLVVVLAALAAACTADTTHIELGDNGEGVLGRGAFGSSEGAYGGCQGVAEVVEGSKVALGERRREASCDDGGQ